MAPPAIMIQGTGSHVGKSLITAGLGRLFARRGLRVMPFKPQNMSNNAMVTGEGGEISRAQALQARACGVPPSVHMNPVLLKPESERGAQVILQGHPVATLSARDYASYKKTLLEPVLESFRHLAAMADLVLVEGAGSPAEINLRENDIANMGFAEAADVPVILVGDIDRGGVIASLVGTHAVLSPSERKRIQGFLINRFRGDPGLFSEGMTEIARRTGWRPLGIVPWFPAAHHLPAEDGQAIGRQDISTEPSGTFHIVVPHFPRLSNFDDLDPLHSEPGVRVTFLPPGQALPGDAHLVILPGSKATMSDLAFLRKEGWDVDIQAHLRRGGYVLGLCGGFQMLGQKISDPLGVEGEGGDCAGLGLLDITTQLLPEKCTRQVSGRDPVSRESFTGYEIHLGRSTGPGLSRPFLEIAGRPEGAVSTNGQVMGTYVHGLFAADGFRRAFLARLGAKIPRGSTPRSLPAYETRLEKTLDALADHLATHLDISAIWEMAQGTKISESKF